ncbi:hypothetical protein [Wolbachia endosymbiont of Psylliodes chrysocephala]|uniref:hypothetical protein n=1 Tax=Wolbachia endosymbiont of Psylliodes chrysocephala TaxID=2883236 RepID=UPI0020A21DCD|nr:hypothetical protein [Wolbachia endosymbiont of Psylliodes chrysocephala]
MKVADTGSFMTAVPRHWFPSKRAVPLLSSQCSFFCHPSSLFFVIPVPRHWDPGILLSW